MADRAQARDGSSARPPAARSFAPSALPILALALLLPLTVVAAVLFGAEPVSLARALGDPASLDRTILLDIRLPRVALAALSGGGLAAVGAAFQALLRNPLAEPYVLGVSGGAALGATSAIAL